jgi:hypothetical protein
MCLCMLLCVCAWLTVDNDACLGHDSDHMCKTTSFLVNTFVKKINSKINDYVDLAFYD